MRKELLARSDQSLSEEIAAEALTRNIPVFARLLKCDVLVCVIEKTRVEEDGILILPLKDFLGRLWDRALLDTQVEI